MTSTGECSQLVFKVEHAIAARGETVMESIAVDGLCVRLSDRRLGHMHAQPIEGGTVSVFYRDFSWMD